ncbi:SDR family oxidoreductase [Caballeronia mineralivorans]|jgi:3-hydroxybutyrate dehydrogenase|uniref:SDR family NAD(P)-dependent oxidoreductase n=1 Tax=Caballeronia mineralivorans TaxID=2010198 RepID=UPI002AFFC700|nr:SDR family oxidoreductase [Caballeronia mineralivorans]
MMRMDFSGSRVLVTGSSRGIGLAIARAFAQQGAMLHLLADDSAVHSAAATLGATGHHIDITSRIAVEQVMAEIGRLDVLINNAGLERLTPLGDSGPESEAVFRRVVEVNVVGTYLMTNAALWQMPPGSVIINTASNWGRMPAPLFSAYAASKHAILGMTKSWAKELGERGIRVNAVCPGWVRTDAAMASLKHMAAREGLSEATLLEEIVATQALRGLMDPDDVAGTYLFLASPLAANITGQSLGVDRGEYPS